MHDHYAREFARSPAGARRLAVALASGTGRSRENKRDSRRFRFSERWQDTIGRLIFYLPAEPLRIGVTFAFTPFSRLMVAVPLNPMAPFIGPVGTSSCRCRPGCRRRD